VLERFKHRIGRRRSEHALGPEAFDPPRAAAVPLPTLLVGNQAGRPLDQWIPATGEYARASLALAESPYVSFLRAVRAEPHRLGDDAFLRATGYYRMARFCADHTGKWFGAREEAGILARVRAFARMLPELGGGSGPEAAALGGEAMQGRTTRGEPIRVFEVRDSPCHEIQDGHHRAALGLVEGRDAIDALIVGRKWTYLQSLVLQGVQTRGRKEVYQPIDAPEFDGRWKLVRRCSDRFEMMRRFLAVRGIDGDGRSMLDLASSYGWFLAAFAKLGFAPHGVERDALAVRIGRSAYRLPESAVRVSGIERFLARNGERFDVVLFLSILHHFAIGREGAGLFRRNGAAAAREIFRHVDRAAGKVLFFDTGEEHETWMRDKLPGWTPDFIEGWLRENGTFDEIVRLGCDEDVLTYPGNYGRTLFACVRKG
jgi:hypothetical protein